MAAANSEVTSGVDTYVLYGVQTSYTTSVTPNKIFGGLVTSVSLETDRQYNERAGFVGTNDYDGRTTAKNLAGTVITSGTVEFDVQRWDWLEHVLLKDRTGSGTSGTPYIYTVGKTPKFLTITEEISNAGTDSQRTFTGMVINSASIRCSVGEPVTASVSLLGGQVSKNTSITSKIAQHEDDVYNFSGGSINMGGALDNIIDDVNIEINNNYNVIYGFSEESKNAKPGKLNLTFRFTTKYLDDTVISQFLGGDTVGDQTPVDIILKFDKADDKYVEFTLKDAVIRRMGNNHNLNEFVVEETDVIAKRIEVKEVI